MKIALQVVTYTCKVFTAIIINILISIFPKEKKGRDCNVKHVPSFRMLGEHKMRLKQLFSAFGTS